MGQAFTVGTAPVSIAAEGRRTALIVSNRGLQPVVFKSGEAGGTLVMQGDWLRWELQSVLRKGAPD